ncbi:MAG: PAS domain S-box protein [Deltaproteobacteria bacterium]|nr:PAS domain S-box protein [Deltaproteobacteria bacterium]
MNDPSSTNSGLIKKIAILEQQIKELEQMEAAHKCVEEALRESEERYRTLVEYATDIVFRTDGTGRFTFVNPAAIRITGYEAKELIGKHYPTLIRQDMRDEAMKFFGRQFVKGIQNTYSEYCIITKDGHEVWLGQNTQLIVENGRVIGFQVVSRDVSAQKQTEEALRESEEKYRLVVENAAESIVIAQDGLLKYMNPMTLKLLGYSEAVLTSMPFVEFIHPEDREKLFEAHIRIMRGEENQPVHQFRVVTSDGTVRWAESRAVVISWEGKPATLNFLTDTTERKRAEELLRESENRYRELTALQFPAFLLSA